MKKYSLILSLVQFIAISIASAQYQYKDSNWVKDAHKAVEATIPQARIDPTRPVYHFRPPSQWMNDICGAIYYKGYYHAFYQYNPFTGDKWSSDFILWAHTRSRNLVSWEDQPWALIPNREKGERRTNSGCVALNGNGIPMIFYTFVPLDDELGTLRKREHWAAVPLDDSLKTWKRVLDKPLMAAGMNGVPSDINKNWSDPFIFKSDGRTFVTFKSSNGLVMEATDKELTQWNYAGKMDGLSGECPNFFPLQDKWVLVRSTHPISYMVGEFDAGNISFKTEVASTVMDYGFGLNPPKDRGWTRGLYGTSTFPDKDGRMILLGWICGFKPNRGWNGCMSLPRVLTLDKENRLHTNPAPELQVLRGKHYEVKDQVLYNLEERLSAVKGDALEIIAEFTSGDAEAFGIKVRQSENGNSAVIIRFSKDTLNIAGTRVPLKLESFNGRLKLHLFLDKSVIEAFINDGFTSVTRVEYPPENDLNVSIFAENGRVILKSLNAWQMKGYEDVY